MSFNESEVRKLLEEDEQAPRRGPSGFDEGAVRSQMGPDPQPDEAPEDGPTTLQEFNRGLVSGFVALPGDAAAGINRAATRITGIDFGGEVPFLPTTEDFQRVFGQDFEIGGTKFDAPLPAPGEERGDLPARILRSTAESLGIGGAIVKAGGKAAQEAIEAGGKVIPSQSVTRETARTIGREAGRRPKTFLAGEAAGVTGVEVGADMAGGEDASDTSRAIGALLGGASVALGPAAIKNFPGLSFIVRKLGDKAMTNFSSGMRARRRLAEQVDDPERAAADIAAGDSRLAPAERTDEPGLLSLQRAAEGERPALARRAQARRTGTREQLEGEAAGPGQVSTAREFVARRTMAAMRNLDRRIRQLGPKATPRQAAEAAREETEKALSDIHKREQSAWESAKAAQPTTPSASRETMESVLRDEPRADQVVPGFLKNKIGRLVEDDNGDIVFKRGLLSDESTVDQLKAARSDVSREIRKERRAGETDVDKIRILSKIENALLEDMERTGSKSVRDAINLTRTKKQTFYEGPVGQMLGFTRRTDPEVSLERLLNVSGEQQGANMRALLRAADKSEDPQTAQRIRTQVEEFLKNKFTAQASDLDTGQLNRRRVDEFVRTHSSLLEEFPKLRDRMTNARAAQKLVDQRTGNLKDELTPIQRREAVASLFIGGPPGTEMDRLLNNAPDPRAAMRQMVQEVSADKSGQALEGLRAGYTKMLLNRARGQSGNVVGDRFLSELRNTADDAVASGLMTQAQRNRLERIGNVFASIDRTEAASATQGGVIGNADIGNFMRFIAKVAGARAGSSINQAIPGPGNIQTPGFAAQRFSGIFDKLTVNRAEELLIRATEDPKLMQAMLTDLAGASTKTQRRVQNRIGRAMGVTIGGAQQAGEQE